MGRREFSLESEPQPAYTQLMDEFTRPVPAGWIDSLERSKAQIEAGKTVPLEPFMDELRDSIARMKKRREPKPGSAQA
jgi:hypothetical protein